MAGAGPCRIRQSASWSRERLCKSDHAISLLASGSGSSPTALFLPVSGARRLTREHLGASFVQSFRPGEIPSIQRALRDASRTPRAWSAGLERGLAWPAHAHKQGSHRLFLKRGAQSISSSSQFIPPKKTSKKNHDRREVSGDPCPQTSRWLPFPYREQGYTSLLMLAQPRPYREHGGGCVRSCLLSMWHELRPRSTRRFPVSSARNVVVWLATRRDSGYLIA